MAEKKGLLLSEADAAAAPKQATRAAYGETLVQLVEEGIDVVAVDADLSGSTTTAKLGKAYPERLINVGIAEADMIDVASGLSLAGKVAFTGSFAVFATGRAYDQIRNTVCYSKLNVKVAPTHAGLSVGPDGGSHQMVEDIALMRVLPNMRVLVPADYNSAKAAIRLAASQPGPVYVRLGREKLPQIYAPDSQMEFGRANVLREGSDVTIVACGLEVACALKAAAALHEKGIQAEVIDCPSIKPLDGETIAKSAARTGCVVTCEEHSVIGGLGGAVAEFLSQECPVRISRIGVQDSFGTSGSAKELLAAYGLDSAAIVEKVEGLVARR